MARHGQIFGGEERLRLTFMSPMKGVVVQLADETESPERAQYAPSFFDSTFSAGHPSPMGTFRLDYIKNPGDNYYLECVRCRLRTEKCGTRCPSRRKLRTAWIGPSATTSKNPHSKSKFPEGDEPFVVNVPRSRRYDLWRCHEWVARSVHVSGLYWPSRRRITTLSARQLGPKRTAMPICLGRCRWEVLMLSPRRTLRPRHSVIP